MSVTRPAVLAAALLWCAAGGATELAQRVPLHASERLTFYVDVMVGDLPARQFLLDTGSSHTTIDPDSLRALQEAGQARYVGNLTGTMADGSERRVPLYRIERVVIGDQCVVHDVRAAVIPGGKRNILGLSVLRQLAPFTIATQPPELRFSGCPRLAGTG